MKTSRLFTIAAVSAGLAFGTAVDAHHKPNAQPISGYDVPSAVQQAAKSDAKGGTIVRWEKEGTDYEAVVDRNGKQLDLTFDAYGKLLSKQNESRENGGKS